MLACYVLLANFLASWAIAYAVGHSWPETRILGGAARVSAYAAAVASAFGFTWVYAVVLLLIGDGFDLIAREHLIFAVAVGYRIAGLLGAFCLVAFLIDVRCALWRRAVQRGLSIEGHAMLFASYDVAPSGATRTPRETLAVDALTLVVLLPFSGILTVVAIVRLVARNHANDVRYDRLTPLDRD